MKTKLQIIADNNTGLIKKQALLFIDLIKINSNWIETEVNKFITKHYTK